MPDADPRSLVRNARALLRSGGDDQPHRRGVAQAARGDYPGAIASFREAIAAVPDAPWSYVALADVLIDTGRYDEAADMYRTALECTPPNAIALRERIAVGLARVGELDAAIDMLRALLAEEPDRSTSKVGLARALLGRSDQLRTEAAELLAGAGDLGDDEYLLDTALDAAPRVPALYRRLAESLARRGERSRAITVLQVGLAHDPDDFAAVALLAELLLTEDGVVEKLPSEERTRLLEQVDRAARAHPDDSNLLVRRARLVSRYGTRWEAAEAWQAVVDSEPGVGEWHRELGDRLAALGDFEAAGVAYDRAVALGYQVY